MTESVADVVREMKMCGDRDEAWERGMSDNSWPTRIEAAHAREVAELKAEWDELRERSEYVDAKATLLAVERDELAREIAEMKAEIEDLKRILIRYEGVRLGPEVEP